MSEETRDNIPDEVIKLPCLYCSKILEFPLDSYEGRGGFYVFCDGDCEDKYAARL